MPAAPPDPAETTVVSAPAALTDGQREEAMRRWQVLRPHLEDGIPLTRVAADAGVPHRTAQRWLTRYRAGGLAGLARPVRADCGRRHFPDELVTLVEGLALRRPAPTAAQVHRQVVEVHQALQGNHLGAHGGRRRRPENPPGVFSLQGQPRGRGKIERIFETVNTMCLAGLPGYAPRGTPDRASRARLSLTELDAALGAFLTRTYNQRIHSETGQAPQARWEAGGFLPHLPDSLEQLDLLLLTVATPRRVHPDGIHFQNLRYLDPTLAAYVGEDVVVRYDPRDLAEIRVFHRQAFACRAICPDLAGRTIGIKDIAAARNARRRELTQALGERTSVVDRLLAAHAEPPAEPAAPPDEPAQAPAAPRLKRYREE